MQRIIFAGILVLLILVSLTVYLLGSGPSYPFAGKGEERDQTTNNEYDVDKLFTKDGCSVFRFVDNHRYHYWVNCTGSVASDVTEICGKNCYEKYEEVIPTKK